VVAAAAVALSSAKGAEAPTNAVRTARKFNPEHPRGRDAPRGVIHKSQYGDVPLRQHGRDRTKSYHALTTRCDPGYRRQGGQCVRANQSRSRGTAGNAGGGGGGGGGATVGSAIQQEETAGSNLRGSLAKKGVVLA